MTSFPTHSLRPTTARGVVALGLVLVWILAGILAGAPAQAADYRYWSYWKSDGSGWVFSNVGAVSTPSDGAVEGWRFAVGRSGAGLPPRTDGSFDSICGSTDAAAGEKRVALVVDFGIASHAPDGERPPAGATTYCAVLPESASGYDVLRNHVSVRVATSGLVCGLSGYPAVECGAAVTATPAPTPGPTQTPTPTPTPAPTPSPTADPAATPQPAPRTPAPAADAPNRGDNAAGDDTAERGGSDSVASSSAGPQPTVAASDTIPTTGDAGSSAGSWAALGAALLLLVALVVAGVARRRGQE